MMPAMMDGLVSGKVKAFYVFGENLANTEPDIQPCGALPGNPPSS
jgi:formate dehydrogenase major subunit